jgi:hypothetical protein
MRKICFNLRKRADARMDENPREQNRPLHTAHTSLLKMSQALNSVVFILCFQCRSPLACVHVVFYNFVFSERGRIAPCFLYWWDARRLNASLSRTLSLPGAQWTSMREQGYIII